MRNPKSGKRFLSQLKWKGDPTRIYVQL